MTKDIKKERPLYDIEAIKDSITAFDVADYFGLELFHKGKNTFIYCPGHFSRLGREDKHPNNCILYENGYYCYGCGEWVSMLDMIAELSECDKYCAIELAGDIAGGREHFIKKPGTGYRRKYDDRPFLKREDLHFIGLDLKTAKNYDDINTPNGKVRICYSQKSKPRYLPVQQIYKKNCQCQKNNYVFSRTIEPLHNEGVEAEYLLCKKHPFPNMNSLRNENYDLYKKMIQNKALETMRKYMLLIKKYVRDEEYFKQLFLDDLAIMDLIDQQDLYYCFYENALRAYQIYLDFV